MGYRIETRPTTIEEFHEELEKHQREAGNHGTDCVCMDTLIVFMRKHLKLPNVNYGRDDFNEWLKSDEYKIQMRIRHIVSSVVANR